MDFMTCHNATHLLVLVICIIIKCKIRFLALKEKRLLEWGLINTFGKCNARTMVPCPQAAVFLLLFFTIEVSTVQCWHPSVSSANSFCLHCNHTAFSWKYFSFWNPAELVNITCLSPTNQNQEGSRVYKTNHSRGETGPGCHWQPSYHLESCC